MSLIGCTQTITIICNKYGRIPFEEVHPLLAPRDDKLVLQRIDRYTFELGQLTQAMTRLIQSRSCAKYLHLKIKAQPIQHLMFYMAVVPCALSVMTRQQKKNVRFIISQLWRNCFPARSYDPSGWPSRVVYQHFCSSRRCPVCNTNPVAWDGRAAHQVHKNCTERFI